MASLKLIRTLGCASERPIPEAEGKVKGKKKMSPAGSLVVLCCLTAPLRPMTGSCFTPLTLGAFLRLLGSAQCTSPGATEHNCQGSHGPGRASSLEPCIPYF